MITNSATLCSIVNRPDCGHILFSNVALDWLASIRNTTKESSYVRYHSIVFRHILPYFLNYRLEDITTSIIMSYTNMLLGSDNIYGGKPLSPKTVSDIISVVKIILTFAEQNNLSHNCNINAIKIKNKEKKVSVFTKHEQQILNNFLFSKMDNVKFGITLSLYMGLRIGEISALKWENVNLLEKTLCVRHTMQRIQITDGESDKKTKIIITSPKSAASARDIPIPDFLVYEAEKLIAGKDCYVLTGSTDKFIEPRTLQNKFKSYCRQCGLRQLNFHCLRHTFATRCVEAGFEIKALSEILGHTSVNITLNRYVHSSFEVKKENMKKISVDFAD